MEIALKMSLLMPVFQKTAFEEKHMYTKNSQSLIPQKCT